MHKHPVTGRRKKWALINGADQQRSCNTSGAFGGISVDVLAIHPVVDGLRDFQTTPAFQPPSRMISGGVCVVDVGLKRLQEGGFLDLRIDRKGKTYTKASSRPRPRVD
jgi:hypothetical protein